MSPAGGLPVIPFKAIQGRFDRARRLHPTLFYDYLFLLNHYDATQQIGLSASRLFGGSD